MLSRLLPGQKCGVTGLGNWEGTATASESDKLIRKEKDINEK